MSKEKEETDKILEFLYNKIYDLQTKLAQAESRIETLESELNTRCK